MRTDTQHTISRHEYLPFPYALPRVDLIFELDSQATTVHSALHFERDTADFPPLVLNGEDIELIEVRLDGQQLTAAQYQLTDSTLTLHPSCGRFTVEIVSRCRPEKNSTLMGLYVSGASLFTQCEAEGFRRITWFPDRPDVMSRYDVTLRGDQTRYPLLLSNGNLVRQGALDNNRHEAVWRDPHPKPSYLFALVAGEFTCRENTIQTRSGRDALLQIYSDPGSEDKTEWALDCLTRSLQWDETRFGLELDLDRFMVVAARDFNMGAMENKGLNVFNSSYVLANPNTATDASYHAIEAVIGHEYFHNWTGNRVTCRDWFQLSLKEGLTVFRDQEFSADMMARGLPEEQAASARAVKRIDDVSTLRVAQFPEDAGPMAHPIRPESYQEIGNFYTATVYEKGAEVIRMQHTLLGEAGFQAGMAEYFRRHDGAAVTCDDFVSAMESVYARQHPGKDLAIFRRWYEQAGTPRVKVSLHHDAATQRCTLTLQQRCEPVGIEKLATPVKAKPPLHIPFAVGLLDQNGQALDVQFEGERCDTAILQLCEAERSWTFENIPERPVPSLLRNFSAPVIVEYDWSNAELTLLAQHDRDPFARWEAGQELATRQILALVKGLQEGAATDIDPSFFQAWRDLARDASLTPAYLARALALPPEKALLEKTSPMDPIAVTQARNMLRKALGQALADDWRELYRRMDDSANEPYRPDALSSGRRSLKNLTLSYLMAGEHVDGETLAQKQYADARNMTDRMGALTALVHFGKSELADDALHQFYEQWQHDPLVVDRWFSLQATAPTTRVDTVRALMIHPAFTLRNPNRARSLIFQFCMNNLQRVHCAEGYDFWAEQVIALDQINPEIAARLARNFDNWSRFVPPTRAALKQALQRIQQRPDLSRNVSEIINKALNIQE